MHLGFRDSVLGLVGLTCKRDVLDALKIEKQKSARASKDLSTRHVAADDEVGGAVVLS